MSSLLASVDLPPKKDTTTEVVRDSANYHPSIWGNHFLENASHDVKVHIIDGHTEQQVQQLKEEVRKMIISSTDNYSQKYNLIDTIQRLGVSYHFESEIEEALKHLSDYYHVSCEEDDDDLCTVALRFRLLRQHGYNISYDAFKKFKDNKGNFKESLISDVKGMLSLYEATHLRKHGEDILDEALTFTTTHLQSMPYFSSPLAEQVVHALRQPLHKGIQRLEARHHISIYQEDDAHSEALLKLAKLDFNQLQKVHQQELSVIVSWWKDLDFAKKLPFARDRVVECYFWALTVYFEPQYFHARRILTKVIALTSILDDIYDLFGTLEELEIFTEAIERWDISFIGQLPDYMKVFYQALLDVYNEIEEVTVKAGRSYRAHYAKEAMKNQVRAYFAEAKWLFLRQMPTIEEYMSVALPTSGYQLLATTSFIGMENMVTKDTFEWVFSDPKIVRASSTICRLMNDMVPHKFEQKRGHVPSAVECYMKQHGVSEQQTLDELHNQVRDAWKDMNQECLSPTAVPMPIIMRVLNLARFIDVVYKDEDGYTHSETVLKDLIASLLIHPVPI
ncbi:hypothetical protein VitviT2T_030173 [Vitis vinifera]|uniref:(-)-germacrene D synthase n=2 Tax=Vitis vinifera TaxID=29760 RepID=A0ABY9E185_VITVI|nr:(-)-germacrene D synthase [Vitis vinifera]WKA12819.1 hypothetical protein VitviT2T_030173 [Vitis vinifera]|eukprot:XP_010644711.1 PREDICTED: (-)-germacrene D synthase [Vitis vinifera]